MTRQAREKYLQKTHQISVAEFEALSPDGTCYICGGKPPEGKNLHVDHDHSERTCKVRTSRISSLGGWTANSYYLGRVFIAESLTKSGAVKSVRRQIRRASIRGALCGQCNRSLGKARFGHKRDNPTLILRAANYLTRHQSGTQIIGQGA